MRQDLTKAYNSAPAATIYTIKHNVPDVNRVEQVLKPDETVLFVMKAGAQEKLANGKLVNGSRCAAVVTDKSIYLVKQGIVAKSLGAGSESVPLQTITGISVTRKLGVGTIIEISRAGNTDQLTYCDPDHAEKWVAAARETLANASSSNGGTTVIQQVDPLDQLKKLKELLDAGILTQEEFDAKKQDIMGKI